MIDGGYVQAVVILVINLVVVSAGVGALGAAVKGLAGRVEHIEERVDNIYDLLIERGVK